MALKTNYLLLDSGTNLSFLYPEFEICTKNTPTIVPSAYMRVSKIEGNKSEIQITVCAFSDATAAVLIGKKQYRFLPSLTSSENFIAQAYQHLKTIPEFADAIDC